MLATFILALYSSLFEVMFFVISLIEKSFVSFKKKIDKSFFITSTNIILIFSQPFLILST